MDRASIINIKNAQETDRCKKMLNVKRDLYFVIVEKFNKVKHTKFDTSGCH